MSSFARVLCALVVAAVAIGSPVFAQEKLPAMPTLTASSTKIALLPIIDKTGEKEDQQAKQISAIQNEVTAQLTERGFKLVDPATITKAIADLKIDLSDEEEHRREPIYKIGKAVDADLVMFVVITQAYSKTRINLFSSQREGYGKTKTWLLDVKNEKPILSGYVREGKAATSGGVLGRSNSNSMSAACGNSLRDLLNDLLKDYPRAKKEDK